MIKIICAWCDALMGYRPGAEVEGYSTSHGICRLCYTNRFPEIKATPDLDAEWAALADSLNKKEGSHEGSV